MPKDIIGTVTKAPIGVMSEVQTDDCRLFELFDYSRVKLKVGQRISVRGTEDYRHARLRVTVKNPDQAHYRDQRGECVSCLTV